MVTRSRKFPSHHGYSRNVAKRDTEQLVAEELQTEAESGNRLARFSGTASDAHSRTSRVALELEPRVKPDTGLDLSAVTAPGDRRRGPVQQDPWWVQLGLRVFRWISWR